MATDQTRPDVSFVKHMGVYGLATLTLQVASIVLLPLYTRHLEPAEYGLVQLLYRIGEVLNVCLMANGIRLATLNLYGHASAESTRDAIAPTLSALVAVALLTGSGFSVILAVPMSAYLGIDSPALFAAGVIAILLQATTTVPLALMQARMSSRAYVITTIGISVSHISLAVLAVGVLDLRVWGVVIALAGTYGGFGVMLTVREVLHSRRRFESALLRSAIHFASPFIPSGLLFFVLRSGDQFFLMKFSGLEILGLYTLGYRIATLATVAVYPFRQVWSAWMYKAYRRDDRAVVFGRVITRGLGLYMFVGVVLVAFMDEVFAALAQPEYVRATRVIAPVVAANFFLMLADLMDAAFYVEKRTRFKPLIAAASTTVMLLLYAVLIPRYADLGAAYATLFGLLVHASFTILVAQRVFRIRLEVRRIVGSVAVSVVICAATLSLGTGPVEFGLKALLCLLWPATLWVSGLVTAEEKDLLLRTAGSLRGFLGGFLGSRR